MPTASLEDIELDIEHFDKLIAETTEKIKGLQTCRDRLVEAYRASRGQDRQAA